MAKVDVRKTESCRAMTEDLFIVHLDHKEPFKKMSDRVCKKQALLCPLRSLVETWKNGGILFLLYAMQW